MHCWLGKAEGVPDTGATNRGQEDAVSSVAAEPVQRSASLRVGFAAVDALEGEAVGVEGLFDLVEHFGPAGEDYTVGLLVTDDGGESDVFREYLFSGGDACSVRSARRLSTKAMTFEEGVYGGSTSIASSEGGKGEELLGVWLTVVVGVLAPRGTWYPSVSVTPSSSVFFSHRVQSKYPYSRDELIVSSSFRGLTAFLQFVQVLDASSNSFARASSSVESSKTDKAEGGRRCLPWSQNCRSLEIV